MATYRGMDGSVTFAAGAVGEVTDWGITTAQEVLETTKMGDAWRGFVGGVAQWTGQASANLDYSNANQKAIVDKMVTATPASTTTAIEFITSSTGPKKFTGNVLVQQLSLTQALGAVAKIQFSFQGSGALVVNWT